MLTIQLISTPKNFRDYLKSKNFKLSDIVKQYDKYRRIYGEFLKTLHPFQLNRELRHVMSQGSYWKADEIHKLTRFYKEEYNEDWLV